MVRGIWRVCVVILIAVALITSVSAYFFDSSVVDKKTDTPVIFNTIDQKYASLGGETGILGSPLTSGEEQAALGGTCRHYQHGSIYMPSSGDAYAILGTILDKWNEMEKESGFLGYPTSDEITAKDGIGQYQLFQEGVILWSPANGAHEMHGQLLEKYKTLGGPDSMLGYPKNDIYWSFNEKPVWKAPDGILILWLGQDFYNARENSSGSLWWTQSTGVREIHGAIWKKWKSPGYANGDPVLGHPLIDTTEATDGTGLFQQFTEGWIYHQELASEAFLIQGKIYEKWMELKGEKGILGYPVSDKQETQDGKGLYQRFEGGSIYWSPNSMGAHEIHDPILTYWSFLIPYLGYPTTDVRPTPAGQGLYATFERGGIVAYPASGKSWKVEPHLWVELVSDTPTVFLGESIYIDPANPEVIIINGTPRSRDADHDLLKDDLEGRLAESLAPIYKFDSEENALRLNEPVTLFQVRPSGCTGTRCWPDTGHIKIRWGFLFMRDGGYGSASPCLPDRHWGDNDRGMYQLSSSDGGFTWNLDRASVAEYRQFYFNKSAAELELLNGVHPVIYMSAGKHHLYFSNASDEKDSHYSDRLEKCDDNVDGNGSVVFPDLHSEGYFNNVGEPDPECWGSVNHSSKYFVNCLAAFPVGDEPGDPACGEKFHSAWQVVNFYEEDTRNCDLWLKESEVPFWQAGGTTVPTVPLPDPPLARFTVDKIKGAVPLAVHFEDRSRGNIDAWSWNFGDTSLSTSTEQNPTYIYSQTGTYTVSLTVRNALGSQSVECRDCIIVSQIPFLNQILDYLISLPGLIFLPNEGQNLPLIPGDGTACDDGNLCTIDDTYLNGGCMGGKLLVCSGPDQPVSTSCDPRHGCVFLPAEKTCPANYARCDVLCTNLLTDISHCGSCGHACELGFSCVDGRCTTECPEKYIRCGEFCSDTTTDRVNCGGCGNTCPKGSLCQNGACVESSTCIAGLTNCQGTCIETSIDRNNCGSCGIVCPARYTCEDGACVAPPTTTTIPTPSCSTGQTLCNGVCTDTASDARNCGSCGFQCPSGKLCLNGNCEFPSGCSGGMIKCGETCTNTYTDQNNCGNCGIVCPARYTCENRVCTPPPTDTTPIPITTQIPTTTPVPTCSTGQTLCNGVCTDTSSDARNCGSCGIQCPSGKVCLDSGCQSLPTWCSGGLINCGDICTNTNTDRYNCGSCGTVCPARYTCESGACIPPPVTTTPAPSCSSGHVLCNGVCVDTLTDSGNCGGCGINCDFNMICSSGRCVPLNVRG